MQFAFDPTPKKPAAKTPRRLSKRASRKAATPAPTASQGSLTTNRSQLFVAAAKQRAVNEHFAELDGEICGEESGEWFGSSFKGPGQTIESEVCTKAKGHDGWHDGGGSTWAPRSAKRKTTASRRTISSDGYWAAVDAQIEQLKSARSSADVIRILGPESASSGDAFFNGEGDEMEDALLDAGWRTYRYEAPYYWVMKAPDGSLITYTEGDVSKGDDANVGPKESRRKTAATAPGYYLVGRASNIIEGPFGSLVQAEARQPEVKAAAIEYKSGVEDPQWESMKAQPFPYGLNTVNGSRKIADYIDDESEIFMCRECGDDSFSPVCPSCEREMEEYYDRQWTPEPGLAGSFTVWNTGSRKRAYYTDGNGGQYEDDSWSPDTRIGCADCGWSGTAKDAIGPADDFDSAFCPDCGKNSMLYPLDLDESGDYTFAKRAVENYINNGGR